MKPNSLPLLAALAIGSLAPASAQVSTTPVGYVSYSSANNSDLLVGVPFTQAPVFSGTVSSVTAGQIGFATSLPDLSAASHFVMVTNNGDPLEGRWFAITSSNSNSVSVAENLATLGLGAGDTVSIHPFWTLNTLFPSGGSIPASSDVFNPAAMVITNNVEATGVNLPAGSSFLYHSGQQGAAGWYDVNNLGAGLVGNTIINPETYITIRNKSGATVNITFAGTVPTEPVANSVVSTSAGRQDNQVLNPFPVGFTLANSNLVSSGAIDASPDVFNPVDRLFVYPTTTSGLRPAPLKTFIYHGGQQGAAGWYDANNLGAGLQNSYVIPGGAALIIRKAQGSNASDSWSPALPYTP